MPSFSQDEYERLSHEWHEAVQYQDYATARRLARHAVEMTKHATECERWLADAARQLVSDSESMIRFGDNERTMLRTALAAHADGQKAYNAGSLSAAERDLLRARKYYVTLLGEQARHTHLATRDLIFTYLDAREYDKALALCKDALDWRRKLYGEQHPFFASSADVIGVVYHSRGDYTEAEKWFRKALVVRRAYFGNKSSDYARSLTNLAAVMTHTSRVAEAEAMLNQADALLQNTRDDLATKANIACSRARISALDGDYSTADVLIRSAIQQHRSLGLSPAGLANTIDIHVTILSHLGRDAEAAAAKERADTIRKNLTITK
jgi:tetratricopeptide (TPR) repeat protein